MTQQTTRAKFSCGRGNKEPAGSNDQQMLGTTARCQHIRDRRRFLHRQTTGRQRQRGREPETPRIQNTRQAKFSRPLRPHTSGEKLQSMIHTYIQEPTSSTLTFYNILWQTTHGSRAIRVRRRNCWCQTRDRKPRCEQKCGGNRVPLRLPRYPYPRQQDAGSRFRCALSVGFFPEPNARVHPKGSSNYRNAFARD